jgi:D-glycero-beta-D-manno-heptose 1-phosphate adenylyltransferase
MNRFSSFPTEEELELTKHNEQHGENTRVDYRNRVCIKPWGHEFLPYESNKIGMWCLTVNKGHSTSLHCHFKKDTLLIVLSGCAKIGFMGGTYQSLSVMQTVFIPKKRFHSISSFSEKSILLEIEIFSNKVNFSDKNDLLRLNDQYHRKPIGYSSSVEVKSENLEEFNYFELKPGCDIMVDEVRLDMSVLTGTPSAKKDSHTILIEGNIYSNQSIVKEGTILDESSTYTSLEPVTVLTLSKYDWREDRKVIHGFEHLALIKKELELSSKNIILTSGCFDVLHVGHLHTLKVAKNLGDTLIVCLSSDEQIRALKGESRPINNFRDRLNLFKTIEYVDYIFPYTEESIEDEQTLGDIMKSLAPHYWVKGTDYTLEGIKAKHPYLRNIYLVPLLEDKSTTNIVKKITKSLKN